ncbi:glucosamine-6-phosphate deaminase [Alistipes indistinctus]|jgi:6-phosphogluconolactonase/glucosamine-6-phosphate isomerase/deaminase|uniref:PIG-L family deacetylase n=1 Tax=Alistipes indistinctus TaxID=626932 RepID=UPI00122F993B|nr:PIG-L family deacetylase [Alistipes indistinctus]KAA3144844.1 glucosamine-6-phosphate deaminase [Alistipes indistinctus]
MAARNYKLNKPGGLKPGADPADIIRKFEKVYTNIFASESSGSMYVAREIENCIREKQKFGELCILGITTGKSPVGVFRALVEIHKKENLSFRNVVVFSLDEFFPISPKEQQSRNWLIHESLLDHVDILPENIHIPDGTLPQDKVAAFCRDYEAKIEEYGGLDLLFLGTGVQGQLGFNEPGSYTNTRTRLVALGNESRQAVSSIFYGIDNVPRKAITMGLGTILKAKRIILMAWGEEKATVIKDIVEGEENSATPATCLQKHPNIEVVVDEGASQELTRVKTPWLVGTCLWPERFIRTAVLWLCRKVDKPILKLTYQDYIDNRLGQLLEATGQTYDMINIQVFNDLQHTISGWPGGKPNADDSTRPERATPYPKRVLIFSPHPDDDVISMGGTFIRLIAQGHDVHVAYQTSGNIAVLDDIVLQTLDTARECGFVDRYNEVQEIINNKKKGEAEPIELRRLKGSIRRAEAKAACRQMGLTDPSHVHFLNLPFYETGGVKKGLLTDKDIQIVVDLLREIKPHQIYAAGDLSDPHGTHRVCIEAVLAAMEVVQDEEWVKECRLWLYRGAWQEWDLDMVDMAVPLSPDEVIQKRHAIYRHLSQKDIVPFPGEDKREFWQRAEERNQNTARLYDKLGMAEYQAIEVFVRLF